MKGMRYLFLTTVKNSLKELLRKPSRLITSLLFVAALALVIVSGNMGGVPEGGDQSRATAELYAIVLALYAVVFVLGINKGLSSGASFYTMSDVNLLFGLPVSPKRILVYGLIKQMGTSLLVGFVLIFQYAWLHNLYGLSLWGLIAILLGYGAVMFCTQLTAMAIYSFTSGNPGRKRAVGWIIKALCAAVLALLALPAALDRQHWLAAVVGAANGPVFDLIPVAGWVRYAVVGALEGQYLALALGLAGVVAYVLLVLFAVTRTHADFYEDVLQATEVAHSVVAAKKEGKLAEAAPAKVKLGRIGLGRGWGASVFFYKHLLENRRGRLFLLDSMSLLFAAMCIAFSFFMREMGPIPVFSFCVYMQLFSTSTGRWARELLQPYVYLAPAPPFRKLMMICGESLLKTVAESLVIFVPIALILPLTPLDLAACVAARIGFGLLFMAGNLLTERLLGSWGNKAMILLLYMLIMLLLCAPGVALGIFLGILAGETLGFAAAMLAILAWNLLAALVIGYLCRNILNDVELNAR